MLCPRRANAALPPEIAPDTTQVGIMLPYTPLHAVLFDLLTARTAQPPVLVMTSANASGEPICLGNREALARLPHLADAWLLHDRDILVRVDDSVVTLQPQEEAPHAAQPLFYRRARGYVPRPVFLPPTEAPAPVCWARARAQGHALPHTRTGGLCGPAHRRPGKPRHAAFL